MSGWCYDNRLMLIEGKGTTNAIYQSPSFFLSISRGGFHFRTSRDIDSMSSLCGATLANTQFYGMQRRLFSRAIQNQID
ncbi:hypothetical protein QE152_g36782 [Popillia japonica]|uniref:Uncharacterized protein n=1 Tax=Popillia japonica TaxID=7064 RepID=A0AAW1ICG7_POPJA